MGLFPKRLLVPINASFVKQQAMASGYVHWLHWEISSCNMVTHLEDNLQS